MNELIGRTVSEVWVSQGEGTIYFKTGDGWLSWETAADCCSETWFADIIGVEALLGEKVLATADLELPQDGQQRTRQESDCVYGVGITSPKGVTTVAYRNSSNGYYGGWLGDAATDSPPGNARQVVSDWSA